MNQAEYDQGWMQWGDMIRYSPAPAHRRRLILELARTQRFDSLLDVGCGPGQLLAAFRERFGTRRLAGIDLSPAVIEANKRAMPSAEFHVLDIASGHLSDRFDLVVCSEVLEHIADSERALQNIRKMCSGSLIVTVPAGRVFPIDRAMGHHRHFTRAMLTDVLERSGFRVSVLWSWGFPWHTAYKYLINAAPEVSMRSFSAGEYSWTQKLVASALKGLFYFNSKKFGSQLIALAQVL